MRSEALSPRTAGSPARSGEGAELNVRDLRIATVEQLYEVCLFKDDNVLQLSPGSLDFTSTQVDLPGVMLEWNRTGARIRAREVYSGEGVMLGFVLQSPSPLKSFGHDFDYGYAVVWHLNKELEYVAPTALTSLVITVDAALADLLGWALAEGAWRRIPGSRLRKLEETCHLATQAARNRRSAVGDAGANARSMQNELLWRDRILADLERVLEPWSILSSPPSDRTSLGTPDFRCVRDTERFFDQYDLGHSVTVDQIAAAVSVSRRTLFHAFRKWVGVGPLAYLRLVRLHSVRHRLLAASPDETSVTEVASDLGFGHMGRLSAAYRAHFGEYPSDTLRRR
jgi:AraC-like DNA-binding protein